MPSITRAKPVGTAPSPATRRRGRSGVALKVVGSLWSFLKLATLPADAVACVFEGDAARGELVAYLVGAREVAAMAGLLPLVDETLDVLVEQRRLVVGEDVQDRVEALDEREDVAAVVLTQHARVERGVDLAPESVDGRERDRSVEVVIHACLELFERARRCGLQLRIGTRLRPCFAQPRTERA